MLIISLCGVVVLAGLSIFGYVQRYVPSTQLDLLADPDAAEPPLRFDRETYLG